MITFQNRKSILGISLLIITTVIFSVASVTKAVSECPPALGAGLTCCETTTLKGCPTEPAPVVEQPVPAAPDTPSCSTHNARLEITHRGTVVVYDTAADGPAGTLFIADIPLSSIRNPTDEERASDQIVWLFSYDSTIVKGWHVDIYWKNGHYGAHITGPNGSVDDTGAGCGL